MDLISRVKWHRISEEKTEGRIADRLGVFFEEEFTQGEMFLKKNNSLFLKKSKGIIYPCTFFKDNWRSVHHEE